MSGASEAWMKAPEALYLGLGKSPEPDEEVRKASVGAVAETS